MRSIGAADPVWRVKGGGASASAVALILRVGRTKSVSPRPVRGESTPHSPGSKGNRETAGRFASINRFVDAHINELAPVDALTWAVLWRDTKYDGLARSSQESIAARIGVSTRTVKRSVRRLKDAKLLVIVREGGLNVVPSVDHVRPP
jgi:hypothetical protein